MELTTNIMNFINSTRVEQIIDSSPAGKNTKFLSAAHSLWTRFHNYEKQLPMCLEVNGEVVSMIFATFNRDKYVNLYEIVTVEGKEGNGYASQCWDMFVEYSVNERKAERLKMSCTPTSVTWHMRNGLIFWAVDPTGSLRSDQKMFATRKEQIDYQNFSVVNPLQALPPYKVRDQFVKEGLDDHKFGVKKTNKTQHAIDAVGKFWLRDALFNTTSLEDFLL
jgi:hypothetical protein